MWAMPLDMRCGRLLKSSIQDSPRRLARNNRPPRRSQGWCGSDFIATVKSACDMLAVGSSFELYKQPGQETRLLVETSAHLLLRSVHRFNGLDD
jgi:hypothetical protein